METENLTNAQLVSKWNERVRYAQSIGLTEYKPINSKFKDATTGLRRIADLESAIRAREASNRAVEREEAEAVAEAPPVAPESTTEDDMAKRKTRKARQKAATRRTRGAVANGLSIADKTAEFNRLVKGKKKDQATWARPHSSLFGSHPHADKMLKKLRAEIG